MMDTRSPAGCSQCVETAIKLPFPRDYVFIENVYRRGIVMQGVFFA